MSALHVSRRTAFGLAVQPLRPWRLLRALMAMEKITAEK